MINFVQTGGFNWVFTEISSQLMKHLPGESITTPMPMYGADTFVCLCPEYAESLLPEQRPHAWSMLHHFEENDKSRTPAARAKILEGLRGVVVFSNDILRQAKAAGIDAITMPHGIDMERFTIAPALRMATDKITVGVCGRNHESGRKGPARIMAIAAAMGGGAPAEFVFCGHGWAPLIEAINSETGCTASEWLGSGQYSTYAKFYNTLDALLVASDIEGGPYPPLEALACGVGVVSTPVGHMPDLVAPGTRNVTLYEFGDVQGAAAAIAALYQMPPDKQLLRASVADRSWEAVARKWAALLRGRNE